MAEKPTEDAILGRLVEWFEDAADNTDIARIESERDRDYYDNKQFTEEELALYRSRGQPPIVVNKIKRKIDFLLGLERSTRTDPRAFPRTPEHEDAAEGATDALRYVADNTDFDQTKSQAFEYLLIEGTCGIEVVVHQKADDVEISINEIPWDRLFWDPHSRARDFSDAKYKGVVVWMDKEDAIERYPDKEDEIEAAMQDPVGEDTFEDVPRKFWVDKSRDRVRICQIYWKREGKVHCAHYTKTAFLFGPQLSPFQDEDGEPSDPLEFQSAYVDRDGQRYGFVRALIDLQDEVNKRRSKALHLLNNRQVIADQGAVENKREAQRQLARADGWIEKTPGTDLDINPTGDFTQGHLALLAQAQNEIDESGPNAALTGSESGEQSGRAILAKQSGGQMELTPLFDGLRALEKRTYRQAWNRIKQFWTAERWIRVTDDEMNLKFVGLNRPVERVTRTVGDQMAQEFPPNVIALNAGDPRMQVPLETETAIENNVAEMDMDIILETAPDAVTIQAEQFQLLTQMFTANPNGIPFDLIIEASQLRNKDRILERLRGGTPEEQQAAQQAQQQAQELAVRNANAEIEATEAKADKDTAQAFKAIVEAQNTQPAAGV